MDWYSWLSKTNLDPSKTYEYSLAFARNELKAEDITFFDHEFLRSLGVSIAKHRLEILNLACKNNAKKKVNNGFTKIVEALKKRFLFANSKRSSSSPEYRLTPYNNNINNGQWKGTNLKRVSINDGRDYYKRGSAFSGPLIGNKAVTMETGRRRLVGPTFSGPLYNGKMTIMNSPVENGGAKEGIRRAKQCRRSQTLQGFDEERVNENVPSLWSLMFQDMKPT